MAVKPTKSKPKTELQKLYQRFWNRFNEYSAHDELFCAEFKPQSYADVRSYQDYAASVGPYALNVGINFNRQECKVRAYFRDVDAWDIYYDYYSNKIDNLIGEPLEWKRHLTKGSATLIRQVKFDKSRNWENAFEQIITDLLQMKRIFGSFYDKIKLRQYWLFSWNESDFRLHDYFCDYDVIDWNNKNNNTLYIGDIVFLYCSSPESTIRYVTEVVKINVPVAEAINDDEYSVEPPEPKTYDYCTRLRIIKEVKSPMLDFHNLELNGLKCSIRSPLKANEQLLNYIMSIIERNDFDYEEIENPDEIYEGAKKSIIVNRYERDPEARRRCIEVHGCQCSICGLDFVETYGKVGEGFIHVHHIVPLSAIGEEYKVDPINDLIPVCPNCHAMLHRIENGKYLTVQELRQRIVK